MEGTSIAFSGDSVGETINFDAETINFDAETINFDAATFDDTLVHQEPEDDYFQQLNHQRGRKLKNVMILSVGIFAACAVAVVLTLFFERSKDLTVSSLEKLDAVPDSDPPTMQSATAKDCIINGQCSEEGSTCAIGKQMCCGETYDSIQCNCSNGMWLCMATDACNKQSCDLPTKQPTINLPVTSTQTPQVEMATSTPSQTPSMHPTPFPTNISTYQDSEMPSPSPTIYPIASPYASPTYQPSSNPPTLSPSNRITSAPSTIPTKKPSKKPSPQPSRVPTSSSPSTLPSEHPSSSQPTSSPSIHIYPSSLPSIMPSTSPSYKPTFRPSTNPSMERKYCVNIKFTSDNFPRDNGFSFISNETGEVLFERKVGFMKLPQTEYTSQICDLSAGSYNLVVKDTGRDGMTLRGNGRYVVDIDGRVILVGGRFIHLNEISHEIIVGFNASNNMSETDQAFLVAHNSRRKKFHESQGVSFRPMAWSAELAAGASAWAKERAKICSNDGKEDGAFGQNVASQRLNSPDDAQSPDDIVAWWTPKSVDETSQYNNQFTAVMWRSALYVGCATEIARIENSRQYCQVTNCRYVRTTNCAVKKEEWVSMTLDENGHMCDTVFCPGSDENGDIIEGACHA